jgi:hypothetical protein
VNAGNEGETPHSTWYNGQRLFPKSVVNSGISRMSNICKNAAGVQALREVDHVPNHRTKTQHPLDSGQSA